ncbi:hypothetical protein CR513_40838, partial [Mucuna pruriens]
MICEVQTFEVEKDGVKLVRLTKDMHVDLLSPISAQGETSYKGFLNLVKDLRQNYKVDIVFLLKTHTNNLRAQQIIQRMKFLNQFIQDPI